jgi:ubiquinone biosynthesis protein
MILKLLLKPLARRALVHALRPEEVERVWQQAWHIYDLLAPTIPRQPTVGGRLILSLGACGIGLYRSLLQMNVPSDDALRLVSTAAWSVYEKMARLPRILAALVTRDPLRRLKLATDLFRSFPFGAPSYQMENVTADPGVVAFDVLRCPVAEFFRHEGHPEVCVGAFCDLDFPLARAWGATLERTQTIAAGAERCDFRWRTPPRATRRSRGSKMTAWKGARQPVVHGQSRR